MREADLAAAMRLKTEAGWNQVEADWRFFLHERPEGCFVAEVDGRIVGTVTTVAYGPRLAWISMMLVDPAFRRQGIGTRLMQAALESLSGWATIALDATPAGRPLYERLGFRAEVELVRLVRAGGSAPRPGRLDGQTVRGKTYPIVERALPQIAALDRAALGADRRPLLRSLLRRAPEAAWQVLHAGKPAGFCLGRDGSRLNQLGPVVAGTVEQAVDLCAAALAAWKGRPTVIDVPAARAAFLAELRGQGFEVQRPLTRMTFGQHLTGLAPTGPVCTFAIAGPEFG